MPGETQDIKKYLKSSENLYEPVMIISRRARQINEELFQKKRDRLILEELEGEIEEEFMHTEETKVETEEIPESEENPVVTAQREYIEDKLKFRYE